MILLLQFHAIPHSDRIITSWLTRLPLILLTRCKRLSKKQQPSWLLDPQQRHREESKNGHLIFITGIVTTVRHVHLPFANCFLTPPPIQLLPRCESFDLSLIMCRYNNDIIAVNPRPVTEGNNNDHHTVCVWWRWAPECCCCCGVFGGSHNTVAE